MPGMVFKSLIFLILLMRSDISSAAAGGQTRTGQEDFNRTLLTEVPYIVRIMSKLERHLCGGALLTSWHILTSCNCVAVVNEDWHIMSDPAIFKVAVGLVDMKDRRSSPVQVRNLRRILTHPECRMLPFGLIFDIAIVVTNHPFVINEFVQPVSMPFSVEGGEQSVDVIRMIGTNSSCNTPIWVSPDNSSNPTKVKNIFTKLQDYYTCSRQIGKLPSCSVCHVCVQSNRRSPCEDGLTGSPVVCNQQLLGVHSFTSNCSVTGMPIVFARLDTMMEWVAQRITDGRASVNPPKTEFVSLLGISLSLYHLLNCM